MIAVDTQILTYAHRRDSQWHAIASQRIAGLVASGTRWAIPFHCLMEFYCNVTGPRMYVPPSTSAQAIGQVEAWLASPTLLVLSDDAGTWNIARDLLVAARIVGPGVYDARIAAVCLQHGVTELWTNDRDYLRFPALRIHNPLVQPTGAAESRARYRTRPRPRASASR